MFWFKAKLNALGLRVPIGFFDRFHDDGYVTSPAEHYEELSERYRTKIISTSQCPKYAGSVVAVKRIWGQDYHIFYRPYETADEDMFIRARTETQFLDRINQLPLLAKIIKEEAGKEIDFNSIPSSEIVVNIGGIHAVLSGGMEICRLNFEGSRFSLNAFEQAKEIYEGGNRNRKTS